MVDKWKTSTKRNCRCGTEGSVNVLAIERSGFFGGEGVSFIGNQQFAI